MRIGLFCDTYTPQVNGVVTVLRTLKAGLEERGHKVFIITIYHPDSKPESGVFRIPSFQFPNEPEHRIGVFRRSKVVQIAKTLELDILHTHSEFSLYAAAKLVKKKLGIPHIHTLHAYYPDYLYYVPLLQPFLQYKLPDIVRKILRKSCCVIAPSRKIQDYLIEVGLNTPVKLVPNGIDLSPFYEPSPQSTEEIKAFKKLYFINDTDKVIVFVGRLATEKNINILLQNFKQILEIRPDTTLLLIGDGMDRRALQTYTAELGIENKVIFTGYLRWPDQIQTAYKASDLFMSASHSEVHPITFIEAMAAGLPIVAADDESISDMVKNGVNGWAIKNDKELWDKAVKVLENDGTRIAMGLKSKELSLNYSINRFVESMIEIYSSYIKK